MRALRNMVEVTLMDKLWNSVIRERCGRRCSDKDKKRDRWFGHEERMNDRWLTNEIHKASVSGEVGLKMNLLIPKWGLPKERPVQECPLSKSVYDKINACLNKYIYNIRIWLS